MLTMHGVALLWLVSIFFSGSFGNAETLKQIHVLFRHGDRAPVKGYPLDPNSSPKWWPNGYGQLTKKGLQQQQALGRWLRQRYGDSLGLDIFWNASQIAVLSTAVDRTLNSAQANLQGLYSSVPKERRINEDLDWSPVPVRSVPSGLDQLLNVDDFCPAIQEERDKIMNSTEMKNITRVLQPLFREVEVHLGINATDIVALEQLYDYLHIHMLYNISLPDWVIPHLGTLKWVQSLSFDTMAATDRLKRLRGGPLVGRILKDMERMMGKDVGPVWASGIESSHYDGAPIVHMYSAHDTTVAIHLQTLGVYDSIPPPYAACVVHELHHDNGSWYINSIYRNDTLHGSFVELRIPGCEVSCTFEGFQRIMKPHIPVDYEAECKQQQDGFDVVSHAVVLVLLSLMASLSFVLLLLVIRIKRTTKSTYSPLPMHN